MAPRARTAYSKLSSALPSNGSERVSDFAWSCVTSVPLRTTCRDPDGKKESRAAKESSSLPSEVEKVNGG